VRGQTTSTLIASFTLLSIFLLLGSLTSASSGLSRMGETKTASSSYATGLHESTFIQASSSDCNGLQQWVPWSVTLSDGTLGTLTESNPANATMIYFYGGVSCPNYDLFYDHTVVWSNNQSVSTITFLVPYGSYSYEIVGPGGFHAVFGQVDFSPSNTLPIETNIGCC
jgi:hypothetical protein